MTREYRTFGPELKFRVALEASKNERTVSQIASQFEVHPSQVTEWKKQLYEAASTIFSNKRQRKVVPEPHQDVEYLLRELGKLTAQVEWFKKKVDQTSRSTKGGNG